MRPAFLAQLQYVTWRLLRLESRRVDPIHVSAIALMSLLTTLKPREILFCREEAYRLFVEQLPVLETTVGLLRAAIAVSLHAFDDIDPVRIEKRLEVLSLRVRERSSKNEKAILANLHEVLFEEEEFCGNMDRYYNAMNGYVPAVLNSRRGLPITLGLIYKVVGEWSGLTVKGINAPGHFMMRVRCNGKWIIVDPFFRGQVLTREEAFRRLERVANRPLPRDEEFLATPTNEEWLVRILGNLRQIFAAEGRRDDLAAMTELSRLIGNEAAEPTDPERNAV
jgi:regulator of sirC expression with transglutaminase-like and TPR domain